MKKNRLVLSLSILRHGGEEADEFFKRGFLGILFILMAFNVFSKELYNDGECSLVIEEISESYFKISCSHENEKTEFYETSPAKYVSHWISEDLARLDSCGGFHTPMLA